MTGPTPLRDSSVGLTRRTSISNCCSIRSISACIVRCRTANGVAPHPATKGPLAGVELDPGGEWRRPCELGVDSDRFRSAVHPGAHRAIGLRVGGQWLLS